MQQKMLKTLEQDRKKIEANVKLFPRSEMV